VTLFDPPVALASLSGQSDAAWARAAAEHVGAAFLGGIALDERTRAAAREMTDRDRNEFLPPDPVAFIDEQLRALADVPLKPGINVRSATLDPLREAARISLARDAILEVNAHCRQEEMCAAGTGEYLLTDTERLREQVAAAAGTGATVSVKVRAEVAGVDLPTVATTAAAAGAEVIHIDAMDTESVVCEVAEATDAAVIANNNVRDEASVREYLEYGADAVSVGRASDNPDILARVRQATEAFFAGDSPDRQEAQEGKP
jgi:TIM-barrel protein